MATAQPPGRDARKRQLEAFGERTGVRLRRGILLHQALTHPSFAHEHPSRGAGNARLEFLGDAVIAAVTSAWLYETFPDATEGQLSQHRARLVSDKALVALAEELDLAPLILLGRGEKAAGPTPKILEDAMEAVIGALFLDRGYAGVEKLLLPILKSRLPSLDGAGSASAKNRLQEILQKDGGTPPVYVHEAVTGPAHRQEHRVSVWNRETKLAEGAGSSRKAAEEAAARAALARFDSAP